jgi:hypothetical protein
VETKPTIHGSDNPSALCFPDGQHYGSESGYASDGSSASGKRGNREFSAYARYYGFDELRARHGIHADSSAGGNDQCDGLYGRPASHTDYNDERHIEFHVDILDKLPNYWNSRYGNYDGERICDLFYVQWGDGHGNVTNGGDVA